MSSKFFKSTAILVAMLLFGYSQGFAQYGNEWIHYDRPHFKFKIATDGLYRISGAQLAAAGVSGATGTNFVLFRYGVEVPVYVSTSGAFTATDFVEFYAKKADGSREDEWYKDPSYQMHPDFSLISDTAVYFFSTNTDIHQRIVDKFLAVPLPTPAAVPYFTFVQKLNDGARPTDFLEGKNYYGNPSVPFYSSEIDKGEGYYYKYTNSSLPSVNISVPTIGVYTGSSITSRLNLELNSYTRAGTTAFPNIKLNGVTVFDTNYTDYRHISKSVVISNLALVPSNSVIFSSPVTQLLTGLSIEYPRTFDFTGAVSTRTAFSLAPSITPQYLSFTGVSGIGAAPILLDLTNFGRYSGSSVTATGTSFYIEPSTLTRKFYFSGSSEVLSVSSIMPVTFKNYSTAANQGNYIITTHRGYLTDPSNPIEDYKTYRASPAGGSYTPVIADVVDLYDQFGYGIEYSPIALRNFYKYAVNTWTVPPEYVFMIGKGLSYQLYADFLSNSGAHPYQYLVPTFGNPGSDNLLVDFNGDNNPELAIGRFSAYNNTEIANYLQKVKLYEAAIKPSGIANLDNTLWKKQALHIAGGSDVNLQNYELLPSLEACKNIYEDTLTGGNVRTVSKNTTDATSVIASDLIDNVINEGVSHITFYGHASSSGFDYNLNNPDNYTPNPRFPIFYAYGCDVAQIFTEENTVGEKYLKSINGGSIAMIASDNFGFTNILRPYMAGLYRQLSYLNYDATLGKQFAANLGTLSIGGDQSFLNIHKQCIILQGDPALISFNPDKADFYTDDASISGSKSQLTTADSGFDISINLYNLGKAVNDSVLVTLDHQRPDGSMVLGLDSQFIVLKNTDTLTYHIHINTLEDKGLNKYIVKLNAPESIAEISFANNKAVLNVFIAENTLKPIYPQEFAIVHQQNLTFKASALNVFATHQNYILEMDTTELFNSSSKLTKKITDSRAGVIKWAPGVTLKDSQVYYWRAAVDSQFNGSRLWENSSFIYLANGSDGWNQSHFYQYEKNRPYDNLSLSDTQRKFSFKQKINTLFTANTVFTPGISGINDVKVALNDITLTQTGCNLAGTLQISVFDSVTGEPWFNNSGDFGSQPYCGGDKNKYQYEFTLENSFYRHLAAEFINSIPNGNYIVIKNYIYSPTWSGHSVQYWGGDSATYGGSNTLYARLKDVGFNQIDSFNKKRVFIYVTKKGDPTWTSQTVFSDSTLDPISVTTFFTSNSKEGTLVSKLIGPAAQWDSLLWSTSSPKGNPLHDSSLMKVYGVDFAGISTLVYTGVSKDTSLSFISATTYPRLRLEWTARDTINRTAPNLDYWRILYHPLPEAALNPLAFFNYKDSLKEGETANIDMAIENLTPYPMDSMLVNYTLINSSGTNVLLGSKRYRPLAGNDTIQAKFSFDPKSFGGSNTILVEANPLNDQPEQYHPNNLGYLNFNLENDKLNPILDVTFDGVHILDKDIVSAKPNINVLLKDENLFSKINDSTMLTMSVQAPGASAPIDVPIDGTIARFVPASANGSGKNEAHIEYRPNYIADGVYKLVVKGKDKAGNAAGSSPQYEINFTIDNKPSITNLLNYPNPFSTSTAFVFTLTGSQIPSQLKIQILSVTGKVVREITKQELGNLHIGRNMTEYKWDGKDQYGQMLGNGVYLYRVVTSINGKDVEHRANASVDKYFKNGFGKMYIMR